MSSSPERTEPTRSRIDQDWQQLLDRLRERYPNQKDSVLFCLHKLQQNPDLALPDIRDEARLHGIPMAGRALHSAKVLLGLAAPSTRRPRAPKDERQPTQERAEAAPVASSSPRQHARRAEPTAGGSIEQRLSAALAKLQSSANADTERLRDAMRRAITILSDALDE